MVCPRPYVTLIFDRLTLKLVCESHLRWGTFIPNLGTLGLLVLELFAMYATDGRTDESNAYCPLPYGPTGSETSQPYAARSSRFGSELPSVEDDVDVWCDAIVKSCMPETTTTFVGHLISHLL